MRGMFSTMMPWVTRPPATVPTPGMCTTSLLRLVLAAVMQSSLESTTSGTFAPSPRLRT